MEDAGNGGSQAEVGVRGANTAGRISFRPEERLPGLGDGQAGLNRDFQLGRGGERGWAPPELGPGRARLKQVLRMT